MLLLLIFYKFSFCLYPIILLFCPIIANSINIYDKILNRHFIILARKKLNSSKTKIIAITGSNGKTSVKNILQSMLSKKYKTQATPASYNTPLGISKFINNSLETDCEFLILEYGARHKKDIMKLCKFFGADFGIITSVSAQHLETFKHINSVAKTKNELAIFLQNKMCVFNFDNLYCQQMFHKKTGEKMAVSIFENKDMFAKNISIIENETYFEIYLNGKKFETKTELLGRHNVTNICLASCLALYLGISETDILTTIETLKQTNHRLSLITTHINILDDSYNCSPSSAKEALWVLKNLNGHKMIATPGIIECGNKQYEINFCLGQQISFCNWCIIIGEHNKKAILDGLKSQNYNSKNIILCKTLNDAKTYFVKLQANDTLLLLNDLPDDYS